MNHYGIPTGEELAEAITWAAQIFKKVDKMKNLYSLESLQCIRPVPEFVECDGVKPLYYYIWDNNRVAGKPPHCFDTLSGLLEYAQDKKMADKYIEVVWEVEWEGKRI